MPQSPLESNKRPAKTATLIVAVEPELRARVEREAERRDTSISSTIRALIRAQLAAGDGVRQPSAGAR